MTKSYMTAKKFYPLNKSNFLMSLEKTNLKAKWSLFYRNLD